MEIARILVSLKVVQKVLLMTIYMEMSGLSKNFLLGKVKKLSKHFIYQASEIIVNLYYALNRRTFSRVCFIVRTGS